MSVVKKFAKLIAIVFITWWIAGCATTQQMSSEDKARIKTVQIHDAVEKGQAFVLAPGGASVGLMFGAIGGAASSGAMADAQTAFVDFLARNSISIEKIVREEMELAVRNSGKLTLANATDSAAPAVKIKVPQYGFGTTHLLSSNVVPVLQIQCEMTDKSGKVIWSASERMLPSVASPMNAVAWAQIVNDPKLIEDQLRKASQYLANKIMKDF